MIINANSPYHAWRKLKDVTMSVLSLVCAILVIMPLGLILFYLLKEGATSVDWRFFT